MPLVCFWWGILCEDIQEIMYFPLLYVQWRIGKEQDRVMREEEDRACAS